MGALMFVLGGCIENDIPYPVIKLDIVSLEAEGLKSAPAINAQDHTVELELKETADIRKVNITNVVVTEGAEMDVTFPGTFDLRNPLYVNLSLYQDYEWTITAKQNIARSFRIEGQIGESEIDPVGHIATAYVPMDFDLSNVKVLAAKFGPEEITTYSPDPMEITSFEDTARNIEVTYHGDICEMWTLRIIKKDLEVELVGADAWAKRIWLYANGRANSDLGFRYRVAGTQEWIEVEDVTVDGGSFSA